MITVECNWCDWKMSSSNVEEVILADATHQELAHDDVRPKPCTAYESGGFRCERLDPHTTGHWISANTIAMGIPHEGVDFRTITYCPDHGVLDCSPVLNGCPVMGWAAQAKAASPKAVPHAAVPGLDALTQTRMPGRDGGH